MPPGWNRWSAMGKPGTTTTRSNRRRRHPGALRLRAPGDYSTDVVAASRVPRSRWRRRQPLFALVAPLSAPHPVHPGAPLRRIAGCSARTLGSAELERGRRLGQAPSTCVDTPALGGGKALRRGRRCRYCCRERPGGQAPERWPRPGRLQNTIFIYAGDNGMKSGEHRMTRQAGPVQHRVPFFVSAGRGGRHARRAPSASGCRTSTSPRPCATSSAAGSGRTRTGRRAPDGIVRAAAVRPAEPPLGRRVLDELPAVKSIEAAIAASPWEAVTHHELVRSRSSGAPSASTWGCSWHLTSTPSQR